MGAIRASVVVAAPFSEMGVEPRGGHVGDFGIGRGIQGGDLAVGVDFDGVVPCIALAALEDVVAGTAV